MVRNPYII